MNIKEQEAHESLIMVVRIVISILIWLGIILFVGNQLWKLSTTSPLPGKPSVSVPVIKQENIDTLRSSVKSPPPATDNLPVIHPEPFD